MKHSVWTIVLVAILALFAAFSGIALLGVGPQIDTAAQVFGLYFMVTLAVVAWMQTRGGALLVTVMGLLFFVSELISAALFLYPQFGDQTSAYIFAGITLIVPLFGFLSYRSITQQG
ncbi:MAG: hypothetical protein ACE5LS_06335 [Thermoplasmata archaeon]